MNSSTTMNHTDADTPVPPAAPAERPFLVPAEVAARVDELLTHYPDRRSASLMVLHLLQEHFGCISTAAVEWTAARLGLPPIRVLELATFYPMFHASPVGRVHLRICRTLSCALNGSLALYEAVCGHLGLDSHAHGPQTTADGKVTVELVECLANCHAAPVMLANEQCHERVTSEQAIQILKASGPEKVAAEHGFEP